MTARFSSAMPEGGVYLVKLRSSASCAAALTCSGVGKSGSPAPKSITSTPSRRSLSTIAVTFIVGEPEMRFVRSASCAMRSSPCWLRRELLSQPPLDHVGHEPVNAAAQREDFLDQPRADVRVLLGGHHEHGFDPRAEPAVH